MEPYENFTAAIVKQEEVVEAFELQLSNAKKNLREAERILIEAFQNQIVPQKFTAQGMSWSLDVRTLVSPDGKENTDDVVDWIIGHGGGDLVKPSMHAGSRDKFLRDLLIGEDGIADIPPELEGLVKTTDLVKVSKRRSA